MTAFDLYPPSGEWTVEDVERFPEDNRRRELVDGSLILRPGQTPTHSIITTHLFAILDQGCPAAFEVIPGIQIRFSETTALVPDLVVVHAGRNPGSVTYFNPEDVVLAVEVLEERSQNLDRFLKPAVYAAAGISCFWRVETGGGIVVQEHHLADPATGYRAAGNHTDRLTVEKPWSIDVPVSTLAPRSLRAATSPRP
ncbi:Uma2 family endonuclease [Actinoplanes awajinensis]|uniref:Putative restriction endonuclease domain-containing protein n=1 Tax=Actinoplanes awajinensis subsp. mycoplanecinus TaxID=135947 RepID=A0A117MQG7_9ACTN|nr:Uma2 family endonuclease [Actinoplanes awajinensis]KUL30189.1 hypothetical protein ADL15_25015 [Actinoplanes awajinensis subsp. mycoplanecinus]